MRDRIEQHLQYMPFGETFIDQRMDDWSSRYTFSAKEKDLATSYNYFGARYYDSDVSVWISVDPLSDEYHSTSAYMYALGYANRHKKRKFTKEDKLQCIPDQPNLL